MGNAGAFFLLIPAVHTLIAVSLALIAIAERRLHSARWGALGFVLAALSLVSDTLRNPGDQNWILWFGLSTHYAALLAMIAAFLARNRVAVPRLTLAIAAAGSVLLLPHVPWQFSYPVRAVVMTGIGAAIIFSALRAMGTIRTMPLVDRLVWYVTLTAGVSYFARMVFGLIHFFASDMGGSPEGIATILMVFHISGAITGFLVGIVLILAIGHDMLALRSEEAERDPLTGLWNRRKLDRLLAPEAAGAASAGAVIVIDLDHFKLVNDRFGHDAGDEVLRRVGQTLDGLLSPFGVVCRVGGEEFVALIDAACADAAGALAISVRKAVAATTFDKPLDTIAITASVGYCYRTASMAPREAIRFADQAVYAAKADGRDRVVGSVFSGGLQVLKAIA